LAGTIVLVFFANKKPSIDKLTATLKACLKMKIIRHFYPRLEQDILRLKQQRKTDQSQKRMFPTDRGCMSRRPLLLKASFIQSSFSVLGDNRYQ
jgi:hypothetical protein